VADYPLDAGDLRRFNHLLERLRHAPLDCDQVATAARALAADPAPILRRVALAADLETMLADTGWATAPQALEPARMVVDYLHDDRVLIPSCIPALGHLDDAVLVDAAWPWLAGELDDYRDFRRLRAIEAELRGVPLLGAAFGREDWLRLRAVEAQLIAHCRRVGASPYLPAGAPPRFAVH
jgi:hypothetical protein